VLQELKNSVMELAQQVLLLQHPLGEFVRQFQFHELLQG
jgi:hypothetical protein